MSTDPITIILTTDIEQIRTADDALMLMIVALAVFILMRILGPK